MTTHSGAVIVENFVMSRLSETVVLVHFARGVVVSHPLSMREALGSFLSVPSLIISGGASWAERHHSYVIFRLRAVGEMLGPHRISGSRLLFCATERVSGRALPQWCGKVLRFPIIRSLPIFPGFAPGQLAGAFRADTISCLPQAESVVFQNFVTDAGSRGDMVEYVLTDPTSRQEPGRFRNTGTEVMLLLPAVTVDSFLTGSALRDGCTQVLGLRPVETPGVAAS